MKKTIARFIVTALLFAQPSAFAHTLSRPPSLLRCTSYETGGIQTIVLHWEDGMEGSMTAQWRDESGETIGYYRQSAIDITQPEWTLLLNFGSQIKNDRGTIHWIDSSGRNTAACSFAE